MLKILMLRSIFVEYFSYQDSFNIMFKRNIIFYNSFNVFSVNASSPNTSIKLFKKAYRLCYKIWKNNVLLLLTYLLNI